MSKTVVYKGLISERNNGEADNILYLSEYDEPLAEILGKNVETYGRFATVKYYVSDEKKSKEELDENLVKKVFGAVIADYGDYYSEYTGYLWTDEEFKVGGHDVLNEIRSYIGKWLYMEVKWSKEKL